MDVIEKGLKQDDTFYTHTEAGKISKTKPSDYRVHATLSVAILEKRGVMEAVGNVLFLEGDDRVHHGNRPVPGRRSGIDLAGSSQSFAKS